MAGVDPLPALAVAVPDPTAQHAVVLEVVHRLEQREGDDRLQQHVGQHSDAEPDADRRPDHGCHEPGVEDVVADAPRGLAPTRVPPLLQPPRAARGADDRARPEPVEALAHPAARRVVRRRDAHVVPAVVLDVEVAVGARGQRDLRQPALVALLLVAELVRGVDAEPADEADRHGQPDALGSGEVGAHQVRETDEEAGVLQRQEQEREPAVVAVVLQRVDELVGRVRAVEAAEHVDQRHEPEDDDRPEPQPPRLAGARVHHHRRERQHRHHERDEPQVALAVAPLLQRLRADRAAAAAVRRHGSTSAWLTNHRCL